MKMTNTRITAQSPTSTSHLESQDVSVVSNGQFAALGRAWPERLRSHLRSSVNRLSNPTITQGPPIESRSDVRWTNGQRTGKYIHTYMYTPAADSCHIRPGTPTPSRACP